jgi:uncharacterized protein YecE (DUF72 family)
VFYPKGVKQPDWFAYYARHFESVEINNTFYRLPSEQAWKHWRDQAPEGFCYAVKGSRYITHIRRLKDCARPIETFATRALLLGEGLGPILWQLPPNFAPDLERLDGFLALLPRDTRHVVEFRHEGWLQAPTYDTLRRHNVALCVYHRGSETSPIETSADFVYIRFHGTNRRYGGAYSDRELSRWAERLRTLPASVQTVYVYFNNDAGGNAIRNALSLREVLSTAKELVA